MGGERQHGGRDNGPAWWMALVAIGLTLLALSHCKG
jgi:hypothetical protein